MKPTFTLPEKQMKQMLDGIARQTGQTTVELLNDVMGLWGRDLMRETYPKSAKQGQDRVQKDIMRVFDTTANLRGEKLKDRVDMDEAEFDIGVMKLRPRWNAANIKPIHAESRDSRGRVRKQSVRYYVREPELTAYIKQQKTRVGRLKAGWIAVAQRYGLPIPAWVARHGGGESGFLDTLNPSTLQGHLTAINNVPYAADKLGGGWLDFLLRKRVADLERGFYAKRWQKKMESMKVTVAA
jgi:hypothetical protein